MNCVQNCLLKKKKKEIKRNSQFFLAGNRKRLHGDHVSCNGESVYQSLKGRFMKDLRFQST